MKSLRASTLSLKEFWFNRRIAAMQAGEFAFLGPIRYIFPHYVTRPFDQIDLHKVQRDQLLHDQKSKISRTKTRPEEVL